MRQAQIERGLSAIARMPSEAGRLAAIRGQVDELQRAPADGAAILRLCAGGEAGRRRKVACALLSAALDAARMASENDVPHGPAFIAAVAEAVGQLAATDGLDASGRMRLAQVYARAGLDPPAEARLTPEVLAGTAAGATQQMPDVAGMLAAALRQARKDPYQAHAILGEALAALPDDARPGLVQAISAQHGPTAQRLALYWLLDPLPATRLNATRQMAEAMGRSVLLVARCSEPLRLGDLTYVFRLVVPSTQTHINA
jgi:hypothetical protein